MISNILDNAQKYSENPIISLKALTQNDNLLIIVSDNGVGIDKKEKELIFKKYYRVTNGNFVITSYSIHYTKLYDKLPVRGQRTSTNARTRKGRKLAAVSLKKKEK